MWASGTSGRGFPQALKIELRPGSQMTTALVHTVPKEDRACNGYIPGVVHLTYLVQHARHRQNLISVLDSNVGSPL